MKPTSALLSTLCFGLAACGNAQLSVRGVKTVAKPTKRTFQYATRGGKKLLLDRYVDLSAKFKGKRPVLVFSYGGGWEGGSRGDGGTSPFLNDLASLGYVVVAIDYRLGIKEAKAKGEAIGVDTYLRAIDMAVEDLYDSTAYILRNAAAWGGDTTKIVVMGGSAGATNSVVAEFGVCNRTPLARKYLPEGFNYGGVISMAGALWLKGENAPATWPTKPCPMLFFHGSKDQLVTYDEYHGAFTGYGPVYLSKQLTEMGCPNWFVDFPGADHVIAGTPVMDQQDVITTFLTKFVLEGQQSMIHTVQIDKVKKTVENMLKGLANGKKNPSKG